MMRSNMQLNEDSSSESVAPVAPVEAVAPVSPEVAKENITLNGTEVALIKGTVQKGRNKGTPDFILDLPHDTDGIAIFSKIVGVENFIRAVFKLIHTATRECAVQSFTLVDGRPSFDVVGFGQKLVDYFNPDRSRKTGPSKAELQALVSEMVNDQLLPLVTRQGQPGWTEDDTMELARVVAEVQKLQAAIEKKTRPAKAA